MSETFKTIEAAKRKLAEGWDIDRANYMLRDLPEMKEVEHNGVTLADLAWEGHKSGNMANNEIEYLIIELELYFQRQGLVTHLSSCALHNAPALPIKPCDCGAQPN